VYYPRATIKVGKDFAEETGKKFHEIASPEVERSVQDIITDTTGFVEVSGAVEPL